MKALTIWQPWASLIVHGLKPVEWRSWELPAYMVGQRIVIHAGSPPALKAIRHLLEDEANIIGSCGPTCDPVRARDALLRWEAEPELLPRRAGLGTALLGEPLRADVLYDRAGLKIGGEGPWSIGWPMLEVELWDEPVPAKGAQGFWSWRP